jgi:hypothetical protein
MVAMAQAVPAPPLEEVEERVEWRVLAMDAVGELLAEEWESEGAAMARYRELTSPGARWLSVRLDRRRVRVERRCWEVVMAEPLAGAFPP